VLDTIGQLGDEQRAALERMEPKLREIYKTDGGWAQIVARQMDFPDELAQQIQGIWRGYGEQAARQGIEPNANEFVIQFIDRNFPDSVA